VDWDGTRAQQGEPAALIGFPAGVAAALDATRTVRTSMSAGIFSKVTPDRIQFDGFTVGGSSGSPVFNANGEVVAVHAAGLVEAAGLGFAVPVTHVWRLLPEDARRELKR
jgi:S1-C subfamily serine protease